MKRMIKSEKAVVTAITTTFIKILLQSEVSSLYHLISLFSRPQIRKQRLNALCGLFPLKGKVTPIIQLNVN